MRDLQRPAPVRVVSYGEVRSPAVSMWQSARRTPQILGVYTFKLHAQQLRTVDDFQLQPLDPVVAAAGRGLVRGGPPIISEGQSAATTVEGMADPVPQALILTAIVIGFGVLAFALALFHRVYKTFGTDDLDMCTTTEQ